MYLWLAGAALVSVVAVYYRGRSDGREKFEYEIKDKRLEDLVTATEVKDEIENLDDEQLVNRASRWVRGNNGG